MTGPFPVAEVHRRWTQGDITALRTATGAGETLDGIAVALDRSPEAVTMMMNRLRLRCG